MTTQTSARAAIDAITGHEAWAIIRRSTRAGDRDTVGIIGGSRSEVGSILDVPLEEGAPGEGHVADRLVAIPFRQVAERGFEVHDDGAPLAVVEIEQEEEVALADLLTVLPDLPIEFEDRGLHELKGLDEPRRLFAVRHAVAQSA